MQWIFFLLFNEMIIWVVKVIEGKVYIGCYQEFGVWVFNVYGGLEYQFFFQFVVGQMVVDEYFWNILFYEG